MDPRLAASHAVLDELYGDLSKLLSEMDDAAVNWPPLDIETNSIAAMTAHLVGANARWLSRATGTLVKTDRAAEFRVRATRDETLQLVEQAVADARGWFASLENVDPAEQRDAGQPGWTVSVAWCVEHALAHAAEHWGQIQLTRQLYAARPVSGTKG